MTLGRLAAAVCAIAVAACAAAPSPAPTPIKIGSGVPWDVAHLAPPFAPEPTSHETFKGVRLFAAGARLRFVSFTLSSQEQLRLERCGSQCATAKLIASWNKSDFERSPAKEIVLAEPGDYYLWLRNELPNGEIGAVQAAASTFNRENGVLRFASGTVVFVAIDGVGMPIDWPDEPRRIANADDRDGSSKLRKLESLDILEKSKHGVKQDLLVQFDPGEAVQALFQQSVPVAGESLPVSPETVARRAEAWSKYKAALHEIKLEVMAELPRADVELMPDLDVSPTFTVSLSSEAALLALLAAPQVTFINGNHRVVLN